MMGKKVGQMLFQVFDQGSGAGIYITDLLSIEKKSNMIGIIEKENDLCSLVEK